MFAYACDKPLVDQTFWQGSVACSGKGIFLFAWGLDAPPLHLPKSLFLLLFILF
jgi:hypothetical protein